MSAEPAIAVHYVYFVIEPVIFFCLQDPKQQEAAQSCSPNHDKDGGDDIARLIPVSTTCERKDSEDDEVCASSKVCELVELVSKGDCEADELICDGKEEGYTEVVIVEHVHGAHDFDRGYFFFNTRRTLPRSRGDGLYNTSLPQGSGCTAH